MICIKTNRYSPYINNFTNKEVGIQFVVLARYAIDPQEGSTVTNITLNLLEVDLTRQTLFVEKQ